MLESWGEEHRRLRRGLNELGVAGLSDFDTDKLSSVLDGRLDRSAPSPHARMDDDQQWLFHWLEQRCEADGPVEVANVPEISSPDSILLELEKVRLTCMRNGWVMAANQGGPPPPRLQIAQTA